MSLVDVVIPTYNRLWALPRVTRFYLDRPEVGRVIVINDGSSDGTRQWLEAEKVLTPRLSCIHHDRNLGASSSRNSGARESQSSLVFFSDDDMLLEPKNGLVILSDDLKANNGDIIAPINIYPESSSQRICHCEMNELSGSSPEIFNPWTLELKPRRLLASLKMSGVFRTPMTCGLMLMKREVAQNVHYDENLGPTSYRDETDFQWKALAAGYKILGCSRVALVDLARNDMGGGCHDATSLAGYEWRACKNNWRIIRRHRVTIRKILGIKTPIILLQVFFMADHFGRRLVKTLAWRMLKSLHLIKVRS